MRCTMLLRGLPVLALMAGLLAFGPIPAADKADEGFKPLFNGKNFDGWKFALKGDADPAKTWSMKDGVIICTGKPNGYFFTDKGYKNYMLRYDWKYARPDKLTDDKEFKGNSGALIHIQDPEKRVIWPQCVEVQGMNLLHGKLYFLKCKKIEDHYDREAKDKATHKVGEWNTTEITCKADGSISAKINGTPVSSGKSDLTEGNIGFQSESAEIHFRKILLKEMK